MRAFTKTRCHILSLGVLTVSLLALAGAPRTALALSRDQPLSHAAYLGAGGTLTEHGDLHPGALIGLDLGLGGHGAVGLSCDATYIHQANQGNRSRVLAGLDLKLLPLARGATRPYGTISLQGSWINETGYGLGYGVGAFFLRQSGAAYFVDLRNIHVVDMESTDFDQLMVRGGVAF